MAIRTCRDDEQPAIAAIVNAGAEKYRGAIPPDCIHDPYMSAAALASEIASGVMFWGWEENGELAGVMGLQLVKNQPLIRHAYVLPSMQGKGFGSRLLKFLIARYDGPILVGTWADAAWAIGFYQRHGFVMTTRAETDALLRTYWTVSDRQIETSVVLTRDPLAKESAAG